MACICKCNLALTDSRSHPLSHYCRSSKTCAAPSTAYFDGALVEPAVRWPGLLCASSQAGTAACTGTAGCGRWLPRLALSQLLLH